MENRYWVHPEHGPFTQPMWTEGAASVSKDYYDHLRVRPDLPGEWVIKLVRRGDVFALRVPSAGHTHLEATRDFPDFGPHDRGYRWCRTGPVPLWLDVENMFVGLGFFPRGRALLFLTEDYYAYLSERPEGHGWEIGKVERGYQIEARHNMGRYISMSCGEFEERGPDEWGYRWRRPAESSMMREIVSTTRIRYEWQRWGGCNILPEHEAELEAEAKRVIAAQVGAGTAAGEMQMVLPYTNIRNARVTPQAVKYVGTWERDVVPGI